MSKSAPLNRLEAFLKTLHVAPGHSVLFADLRAKFLQSLPVEERGFWSRFRTSRELNRYYPVRPGTANKRYVFGLSFEKPRPLIEVPRDRIRYVSVDRDTFFVWRDDAGKWERIGLIVLRDRLRKMGCVEADISDAVTAARANLSPLDSLFAEVDR